VTFVCRHLLRASAVLALLSCDYTASAQTGSITATECSAFAASGRCTLTLNWSTSGVTDAEVRVRDALNNDLFVSSSSSGPKVLDWIEAQPQSYTFTLYRVVSGNKFQLASTSVSVSSTLSIDVSSLSSNLNYGDQMLFNVTVRDGRANLIPGATVSIIDGVQGGRADSVITGANGSVTFGYVILSLVQPNTYNVRFGPAIKQGYNQSTSTVDRQVTINPPPSPLSLTIDPTNRQFKSIGQSIMYTATVRDQNGNGVFGAALPVFNPIIGNTILTTQSGGTAIYSFSIPPGATAADHVISFGNATKQGYNQSPIVQRTVTVQGPIPSLTLDVEPSVVQTVAPGASLTYTATIRDGNGSAVSEAALSVSNPFTSLTETFSSNASGTVSYTINVSPSATVSNRNVSFQASKTGYTDSNPIMRLFSVSQAISPTAVMSLSGDGKTGGNNATLEYIVQPGASVSMRLDASGSTSGTGSIAAYEWRVNDSIVNLTSQFDFPLSVGSHNIALKITNTAGLANVASAKVQVATAPTDPTLTSNISTGVQNSTITLSGVGYSSDALIERSLVKPGGSLLLLSSTRSTSTGEITWQHTFSCLDPSGRYEFAAFDRAKNKLSPVVVFQLSEDNTCDPDGDPAILLQATLVSQLGGGLSISGRRFTRLGSVRLEITPPGSTARTLDMTTANGTGLIYYFASLTCKYQSGTYVITAHDLNKAKSSSPVSLTVTASPECGTPGPKITQVSPDPVPGSSQEQFFTLYGSEFTTGMTVRLQGGGRDLVLNSSKFDQLFTTQVRVKVNFGISAGTWTATVSDSTGSQSKSFQVSEGTTAPQISSTQNSATKGVTLPTSVRGLTPESGVEIWIRYPDQTEEKIGTGTADANGNYTHQHDTRTTTKYGTSYVRAKNVKNGTFSNEVPRTINEPVPQRNFGGDGSNATHNDPIDTSTGNYSHEKTDLVLAGKGMPLRFTRHYNAQDGTPGPIGRGWGHAYQGSLITDAATNAITVHLGDGFLAVFDLINGSYQPRQERVYATLTAGTPGVYILRTPQQIEYTFTNGSLTKISDRNSNSISIAYDSTGNLSSITDTAGRIVTVTTTGGKIASIKDPLNRTVAYTYDSFGNLVAVQDARLATTSYTYDGSSRMLTGVDPLKGVFVTNIYDTSGRVISQKDGEGNEWLYAYSIDVDGNLVTTITDPNSKTSTHVHDVRYRLLRETDSLGKKKSHTYDDLDNRTSVTDRRGNTTTFGYDSSGNVIKITDPLNGTILTEWNSRHDPTKRTDQLNRVTQFGYDARGNLTSITDPAGSVMLYAVNNFGLITTITDALGRTTTNSYDAAGNLTFSQDSAGGQTQFTYDDAGRRLTSTTPRSATTTYTYDSADNIIRVVDPLGNGTDYMHDENDNLTEVKDPLRRVSRRSYNGNYQLKLITDSLNGTTTTTFDKLRNPATIKDQRNNISKTLYDSENRISEVADPLGHKISYSYDADGNRTSLTDSVGNTTTTTFDAMNRVTSTKDANGSEFKMQYDAVGQLTKKTDPGGLAKTYVYDLLGRIVKIIDAAGGVVAFEYDKVGNRTKIIDPRGKSTSFTYDSVNRVKTITDALGNVTSNTYDSVGNLTIVTDGNGNTRTYAYDLNNRQTKLSFSTGGSTEFSYDVVGNRTKMVDPTGTSEYTYDDLNRIVKYKPPFGSSLTFEYDASSNRTAILYPSGAVQYTFDAASRMTGVRDWNGAQTTYTFDANSRITTTTLPNGVAATYAYDAVGQITSIRYKKGASVLYSEALTWSANGNPLSNDISGLTGAELASQVTAYSYDDASRLTSTSAGPVTSDRNNNVTLMPGLMGYTALTYDLNNRPTQISGGGVQAQMKYFGDGKLAEMSASNGTSRYIQDPVSPGNRVLIEVNAAGAVQRNYIYGAGMISSVDVGGGTRYFTHNLQGSTVALVDSAGIAIASYRYDPFGRVISKTGTAETAFTFLGRHSVPSIGGYSITSFRLYDSGQGRFTSSDPMRFALDVSMSPFLYARQSPLAWADPSGLTAISAADIRRRLVRARDASAADLYFIEEAIYYSAAVSVLEGVDRAVSGITSLFFGDVKGAALSQVDQLNTLVQHSSASNFTKRVGDLVTFGADTVNLGRSLKANFSNTKKLASAAYRNAVNRAGGVLSLETLIKVDELGSLSDIPGQVETILSQGADDWVQDAQASLRTVSEAASAGSRAVGNGATKAWNWIKSTWE
jgi:RHS repeat-associated protein